jgi:hypothetical protein
MKIEIDKLKTIQNFGKLKDLSRQRVYQLIEVGRFDTIEIDGVKFIIMNKKAVNYKKQI